jgi:hypothetical protein
LDCAFVLKALYSFLKYLYTSLFGGERLSNSFHSDFFNVSKSLCRERTVAEILAMLNPFPVSKMNAYPVLDKIMDKRLSDISLVSRWESQSLLKTSPIKK